MTMKSTRLALALFGALSMAAPLAAQAAPLGGGMMGGGMMGGGMMGGGMGHMDSMHDHNRRPPARSEHRPPAPHGHYRWRTGNWTWSRDHWVWAPGIYIRF